MHLYGMSVCMCGCVTSVYGGASTVCEPLFNQAPMDRTVSVVLFPFNFSNSPS